MHGSPARLPVSVCPALKNTEKTIKVTSRDVIALTGILLKAGAVKDVDIAASVFNQSGALQICGRQGHTRTLNTQHHGQEFLRERELIASHAISGAEQPAGTSLFKRMEEIARSRLRHLIEKRMRVMQHGPAQWFISPHGFPE